MVHPAYTAAPIGGEFGYHNRLSDWKTLASIVLMCATEDIFAAVAENDEPDDSPVEHKEDRGGHPGAVLDD